MDSSNQAVIFAPAGSNLARIFSGNKEKETPARPFVYTSFNSLLEYHGFPIFNPSPPPPPLPTPPPPPPMEPPEICFSDLTITDKDETMDYEESRFDRSAWKRDLLKIAWEIGVPQPGSEQYDSTMKLIKKNSLGMTLCRCLKEKRAMLKHNASFCSILDKVESGGPEAIKSYWNDKDVLYELGVALGIIEIGEDDDQVFVDVFASIGMVFEPRGRHQTEDDWDEIRMRLFVMLLAKRM